MMIKNTLLVAKPVGIGTVAVLLLVGVGCGRRAAPPARQSDVPPEAVAAEPTPPEDPVARILMQSDELLMNGATNEALATLQAGLDDPALAEGRPSLFNGLIRFLLFTGQGDEARARMLDAYRNDATLAIGGLGLVYGHLMEQGDMPGVIAWTEEVLAIPSLPEEVRRNMREWNLLAYVEQQNDPRVLEIAAQLVRDAPAGNAMGMLSRAIDAIFEQKRPQTVEKILVQMGKVVTSDADTRNLLLFTRIRLMAVQGDWDALKTALPAIAAKLPDADLQRLLRMILPLAGGSGKTGLSDALCLQIIEEHRGKSQSFVVAGRQWIDNVMAADQAALPARLERLQQAGFPIRQVCSLYLRFFYDIIDEPVTVEAMKQFGSRIAPLAEDDETRQAIRTMVLDASFVLEDYATALSILKTGISGRDPAWHAMATSKVKAHQAMKENRPRDAVTYFREFMATVVTAKEEDTSDPSTGVVHSREMILGRNAKRIGDILAGMQPPDMANAAKAYAEAKDFYGQALAREQEPDAIELIRKEMAGLL